MTAAEYPLIQKILATPAPARLYHYTSPAGLIGIVTTRTLWATHVRFLNDTAELNHALTPLRASIELRIGDRRHFSEPEIDLLQAMLGMVGRGSHFVYVAALTERRDDLSQWRAYCPSAGGYAFGIPSGILKTMAATQGYYLAPCVYDGKQQQAVVNELVNQQILCYRQRTSGGDDGAKVKEEIVEAFSWEATRYCATLKHRAFKDEQEWRLVSPHIPAGDLRISYRPGRTMMIPYVNFSFLDRPYDPRPVGGIDLDDTFQVVVGPTVDPNASMFAGQSITMQHIGIGWCGWGGSDAPFRE